VYIHGGEQHFDSLHPSHLGEENNNNNNKIKLFFDACANLLLKTTFPLVKKYL
jgi:hypothetical protein